ncbi:MAG: DUF3536 domain-containing protein [Candidatus Adiutrix sp.]|jgi:alpha-amylase/alpha-mannosidase (GH57 family)|nr:DUF3536 domain-containing protein [Candidatus Adiutrix sp.]
MTSSRYLVIHGHFYQPPRENPWILAVEPQVSAAPYADWNRRIDRECYAPNSCSRLLDGQGRIARLVNNYEYLSFNFGPTLLSWMEKADPETYARLLEADRQAAARRGGHGPALAQVYNHLIMPLATARDRWTQIRWGLADFESRFGRRPEGLWLAETAVDLETLKMLARAGLKFTILAQGQAAAVRPLADRAARPPAVGPAGPGSAWQDVSGARIDPREPYRVFWGGGETDYLDVFFYDGPVSRAIAFEQLLRDGNSLLGRIEQAFGEARPDGGPRLVNLATDGESYGHHFQFGDMALAWLFNHLEEKAGEEEAIQLTNYGQYLEFCPPRQEAAICENTSWSCAHGLERWRSDCGCRTGGGGGAWNQKWRRPLRDGLNWLRDRLAELFEKTGGRLLRDPWAARDDYVRLLLARYDDGRRAAFLKTWQKEELSPGETATVLALMESQLMSLYMFTSCGWFFDEISGLEPVQNLRYALRAIELTRDLSPEGDLGQGLMRYLEEIVPNDRDFADGLDVWRELVIPARLGGRRLTACWAAATLLNAPAPPGFFQTPRVSGRRVIRLAGEGLEVLAARVDLSDPRLARSESRLCLALYAGGVRLAVLVGAADEAGPDWLDEDRLPAALGEAWRAGDSPAVWEGLKGLLPGGRRFALEDLPPACRGPLLSVLAAGIHRDLKNCARDLFRKNQPLLRLHHSSGRPADWVERFIFRAAGEGELERLLSPADSGRPIDLAALGALLNRRGRLGLVRDELTLRDLGQAFLQKSLAGLTGGPAPGARLKELLGYLRLLRDRGFSPDLWAGQNLWHKLRRDRGWTAGLSPEERRLFNELGEALGFNTEGLGS